MLVFLGGGDLSRRSFDRSRTAATVADEQPGEDALLVKGFLNDRFGGVSGVKDRRFVCCLGDDSALLFRFSDGVRLGRFFDERERPRSSGRGDRDTRRLFFVDKDRRFFLALLVGDTDLAVTFGERDCFRSDRFGVCDRSVRRDGERRLDCLSRVLDLGRSLRFLEEDRFRL